MKKPPRKTRRQLQAEKTALATKLVEKANSLEDPLDSLTQFHNFPLKDGSSVKFVCESVKNVSEECKSWIFDLMERNMKEFYEKSQWGWNAETKKSELTEDNARFLIAKQNEVNIGFSHFRFDIDDGCDVLYCYELQLESSKRRKGIGKFMMEALEMIASKNQLQKIVLTVLKNNPSANSFFYSLGYKVDVTNPPASAEVDYIILSKRANRS